jgi:hypothetical protein
MGFEPVIYALGLLAMLAVPSNDLLDYIPTAHYWHTKQVDVTVPAMAAELTDAAPAGVSDLIDQLSSLDPQARLAARKSLIGMGPKVLPSLRQALATGDPETAAAARELIRQISAQSKPASVRRLMAIRALGESGDPTALAILQPLLVSTAPFEAEYAAAAIAALRHQPTTRPALALADRAADAWHLPADCCMVWQSAAPSGHPINLDALIAQDMAMTNRQRDQVVDDLYNPLIEAAETVGNVRIQSVTAGLTGQLSPHSGYLIFVLRGQYDSQALIQTLLSHQAQVAGHNVDGVDVFSQNNSEPWLFMPSDQQLVVVAGPGEVPIESIVAAVTQGKGDLHSSPDLSPVLASTDMSQRLWGMAKVTDSYRQYMPILAPFDTIVMSSTRQGKMVDVKVSAAGNDPDGAKASVGTFNGGLSMALAQLRPELILSPLGRPVLKMLESIHCAGDGGNATATMEMPSSLLEAVLSAGSGTTPGQ